jgi:hypothetical protein
MKPYSPSLVSGRSIGKVSSDAARGISITLEKQTT